MGAPGQCRQSRAEELLCGPDDARPDVALALLRCGRGQVVAAREGGAEVAVAVLADGRAFVLPDRCPHDGGWLHDGFVDGERVVCARHGWEVPACAGRRACSGPKG